MKVTSKITLDASKLNKLDNAVSDSLWQVADEALGETIKRGVMPFNTGNLQNDSSTVIPEKATKGLKHVQIASSASYAGRLYYHPELNFRKTNNSKAGARWFDWIVKEKFVQKTFPKLFKRNSGL